MMKLIIKLIDLIGQTVIPATIIAGIITLLIYNLITL